MRHTGSHQFKSISADNGYIQNLSIIDKLSIPARPSLEGQSYTDIFYDGGNVNTVDNKGDINQLLDLKNPNLLKSLLVSEIVYDEIFNFDKTNSTSFNEIIDIEGEDFYQYKIQGTYTAYSDQTSIPKIVISFATQEDGATLYNNLLEYSLFSIPIRTDIVTNGIRKTYMIQYNSLIYNSIEKTMEILLNEDTNKLILDDLTNTEIIEISINNFTFGNTDTDKRYTDLPNHYHLLEDISNIEENTNLPNGYLKLEDNNLKLPFNQFFHIDTVKTTSALTNNIKNTLLNKRLFNLDIIETNLLLNVNYSDTTIDLGNSIIIEYQYTNTDISFSNNLKLFTNDQQMMENSQSSSIFMQDQYVNSYLAQKIIFDYNAIISDTYEGVITPIELLYEWIDKTSIDNNEIKIYDILDNTATILTEYYDFNIVMPSINTPPFILMGRNLLYKGNNNSLTISIPYIYNVNGEYRISISNDSDMYITSDSTVITFDIYEFNNITMEQDSIGLFDNNYINKKIRIHRSLVKIIPSLNIPYLISIYSRV